jgi:hypothetical protein
MDGLVEEEKEGRRERRIEKRSSSTLVQVHNPGLDLWCEKTCYIVRSVVHWKDAWLGNLH